jgi:hypothetical protein
VRKSKFPHYSSSIVFVFAIGSIVLIYATLWNFVGRFPAESMQVSRDDARSVHALCYDKNDKRQVISIADPARRGSAQLSLPIEKQPSSAGQLGQIAGSRALSYSVFNKTIYIINSLDPDDVTHLNDLAFWGILDPSKVANVIAQAGSFSPPCRAPPTDEGVTEYYWATKGTAVLHHWAFLYDATVSDGKPVHAQYGYLVAKLAQYFARSYEPGPTGFVRCAWILFCLLGVVYSFAFLTIFRRNFAIAVLGLSWQIALYASVGAFSLLLAPGYHWSRELVVVMPALFLVAVERRNGKSRIGVYIALALLLFVLAVALDPTFAIVSLFCLGLAFATTYWRTIRSTARARPALFVAVLIAVLGVLVAGLIADASNIVYIASMTSNFLAAALAERSRDVTLTFNLLCAALVIGLCAWRRLSTTAAYFGFISIVSYEYFVITPDQFHWQKYQEFVVPIFVALLIAAYSWLASWNYFAKGKRFVDGAILLTAIFLLLASYRSVTEMPPNWELRVYDSVGAPYFSSVPVEINGRMIDANINQDTIDRLKTFPAAEPKNLIVSPLDKYILFLYDQHNGFPVIDETAWMDNDSKLANMETFVADRHAVVVIDTQEFEVNPTAGLLSTNPVMGAANSQSILSMNSRIRMSEFAAFLAAHCTLQSTVSSWQTLHC